MVLRLKTCFRLVIIIPALLVASLARAEDYVFKIIDQHGLALSQAVVEPIENESPKKTGTLKTVDQINKQFAPQQLIILKGDSVEFPNSDNIRHHVYSFSKAKVFELKLYANKPERPIVFDEPGIVVLGCNIHDSMIGYLYVATSDATRQSDDYGRVEIKSHQPLKMVRVWHAQQASGAESQRLVEIETLPKNTQGELTVEIKTTEPAPRNSFEDVFGVDLSN